VNTSSLASVHASASTSEAALDEEVRPESFAQPRRAAPSKRGGGRRDRRWEQDFTAGLAQRKRFDMLGRRRRGKTTIVRHGGRQSGRAAA